MDHEDEEPDEADGDMASVGPDEGEKGGDKCASFPAISLLDQVREFTQF